MRHCVTESEGKKEEMWEQLIGQLFKDPTMAPCHESHEH